MDGLECSEILFSQIDLGDRFDSDYYTKNYLHISDQMSKVPTEKLGKLATTVASAFYPAATQLYSEGDTAFARCVDCVSYPVITKDQDSKFEKIPYAFGKENKGISFIKVEDIIITKVGTPCYASILTDYSEIALSRTVMGLTGIHSVDPYYLMVFLRCKYGFDQLFRQRELTIQYQLTLPRVKAVDVYLANDMLQIKVMKLCKKSKEFQQKSNEEIAELFVPVLKEHGIEVPFEKVVTVMGMMKDRVSFVRELWDVCSFFFVAPVEYDEKTVKKRWKEDSAKCMTELAEVLAGIEDFSIEGQEKIVMDWIAEKGYHTGNIMNAFRLTLVGEGKGPHMFDISWVLGKEETLARIKRAVEILK